MVVPLGKKSVFVQHALKPKFEKYNNKTNKIKITLKTKNLFIQTISILFIHSSFNIYLVLVVGQFGQILLGH